MTLSPRKVYRIQESVSLRRDLGTLSPGGGKAFVAGAAGTSHTSRWPWLEPLPGPPDHSRHHLRAGHFRKLCSQTKEVQESLSHWPLPCPINTATPLLWGGGFWEELGWVGAIQPKGSQTTCVCIPVLLLTSCWTLGKLT